MSPNIPGNVLRYPWKCYQTFRGMSSNIPGNVTLQYCFYTLVLWQQGKYSYILGELNQDLCGETSLQQPLCYSKLMSSPNTLA